ncbi:MAG TPA: hypothetical protein VFZ85_19985 [Jiangellaceae bacterium]
MSSGAVGRAVRGRWQIVLPGVYATFTGPLGDIHRLRAAVLYAGPGALITGAMACRMCGLDYGPDPDGIVDVLVGPRRQRPDVDFVRLHRTSRMPAERLVVWEDESPMARAELKSAPPLDYEGDPLTDRARRWTLRLAPQARAAMDAVRFDRLAMLAEHPSGLPRQVETRLLRDTRALLCEVVQRRRAMVADLVRELEAAPNGGLATARQAMADVVVGCRSAPECELRDLASTSRVLPEPRWNRPLPGYLPGRGERPIIPDCCWPDARLVVEVNSTQWHKLGDGPERTERRMARYAQLGWLVIPLSPYRIRTEPAAVLNQLEATYLARVVR